MDYNFYVLRTTRQRILDLLNGLSVEQLNKIPTGFNNNIIWNATHTVVTQQLVTCKMAGLEPKIETDLIEHFKKGTSPQADVSQYDQNFIDTIKSLLVDTAKWLEEDYKLGLLNNYSPYTTSFGIELNKVEDAIAFNNTHEAMHLGNMQAMKKLV